MSWQEYINEDLVGSGDFTHAIIIGHDGEIWAKSIDLQLSDNEVKELATNFIQNEEVLYEKGITLSNKHYIVTNVSDNLAFGKRGLGGVIALKTKQAILIGIYGESQQPGKALLTIEKLGKYLIEQQI